MNLSKIFALLFLFLVVSCNSNDNSTNPETGLPVLTTTAISEISQSSATSGGNITSDGGMPITSRGVCWSINNDPTTSDNVTNDGSGDGEFTSVMTVLAANTTYYVRAYATNNQGTSYGEVKNFSSLASITTNAVGSITQTTAQCGGNISEDGNSPIAARGVCWSTNPVPTINDNLTSDGTGFGSFTSTITGLSANTIYYVCAYATNSEGTNYGDILSFPTLPMLETGTVVDIDGNSYQTVLIGDQWWMAENLRVTHYRNGVSIPNIDDDTEWSNLSTGAYCNFDNDENNSDVYGRLYNWYAVDDSQNIAPSGWHIPTDDEWKQLEIYLGMSPEQADTVHWRGTNEGGKLKEAGTFHWANTNSDVTNESGFTALPGGFRYGSGLYMYLGGFAEFWTSTLSYNNGIAWYRGLNTANIKVCRGPVTFTDGLSIRCIKNRYGCGSTVDNLRLRKFIYSVESSVKN